MLYRCVFIFSSTGMRIGRGGPMLGQLGWGGPSTGPKLLFIVVVSPCRCELLLAGCYGGEGVLRVS